MSIDSNKKDLQILLNNMNKYMLIDNNISLFKQSDNDIKTNFFNTNSIKKKEICTNENQSLKFIYINKFDVLFWCFYLIKNDYDNYETNKTNSFYLEKSIKINSIELLRENKELLKKYKLKLNDIENEMANEKKITIKGFIALLIINDLNIFFVGDNLFYKLITNQNKQVYIIKYNKQNKKMGVCVNDNYDTNSYIKSITETHMLLTDIIKQIKSISSYKLGELQDLCHKLKINIKDNNGKNIKKTLLYETLLIKLNEDSINNIS
tara:strand:- start:6502 stop:7296 length:795 start_codon:yes stop_codon:yes gene_type:complete